MASPTSAVPNSKETEGVLNDLIETCLDGKKGFKAAAEKAEEGSLRALFFKYSSQRSDYASQLTAVVSEMGGDPATSGHAAAGLHRGWISVKEALSSHTDTTLIDECEAGEDAAMKNYKEALQKSLPATILSLVQEQFAGVSAAHGVIRDLKHSRH